MNTFMKIAVMGLFGLMAGAAQADEMKPMDGMMQDKMEGSLEHSMKGAMDDSMAPSMESSMEHTMEPSMAQPGRKKDDMSADLDQGMKSDMMKKETMKGETMTGGAMDTTDPMN